MKTPLIVVGRGIGQVMFQNNALSGALMLLGIFLNSWQLGLLAVSGTFVSTVTACILGYERAEIEDGLYGFNGTLVGIATGVFFSITPVSVILAVIFSALSTPLAKLFRRQSLFGGYTGPFIIAVWLMLWLCGRLFPELFLPVRPALPQDPSVHWGDAFFLDFGQVMFQSGTILSGVLFLAAIVVNSPVYAFYAVLGSLLANIADFCYESDHSALNVGLIGYNAVLAAMALGDQSVKGFVLAVIAVLLSLALQLAGMYYGVTTLTAPFVLAVWIVGLMKTLKWKRQ